MTSGSAIGRTPLHLRNKSAADTYNKGEFKGGIKGKSDFGVKELLPVFDFRSQFSSASCLNANDAAVHEQSRSRLPGVGEQG